MMRAAPRPLRMALVLSAALLLGLLAAIAAFSVPSTEAVRLRNALLLDQSTLPGWEGPPDRAPATFLAEHVPMPPRIRAEAASAVPPGAGDLQAATALAGHLLNRPNVGTRIDAFEIDRIYAGVVDRHEGYCADIVDSYIALAHAAGLGVRAWAFSFDGLGGHGHVLVEIYDRSLKRWLMLDVFNNARPVDATSGEMLAAMAFRDRFLRDPASVRFVPIGPWRQEFKHPAKLVEYYARGIGEWYLWNGNNVAGRADHWLVRASDHVAEALAEGVAMALGQVPKLVPVPSPANQTNVRHMVEVAHWLRIALGFALALGALTVLLLAACLLWPSPPAHAERTALG